MSWLNDSAATADYYDTDYNTWSSTDASTTGTYSGITWYSTSNFYEQYNYLPEKFKDKHGGMPLEDFLKMWQDDGYRIIEVDSQVQEDGNTIKRYNVYSEEFLNDYGNHLGFVVILDKEGKLLDHEIYNIRGR